MAVFRAATAKIGKCQLQTAVSTTIPNLTSDRHGREEDRSFEPIPFFRIWGLSPSAYGVSVSPPIRGEEDPFLLPSPSHAAL